MLAMSSRLNSETLSLLRSTLEECRQLYISSGQLCAQQYPQLISQSGDDFVQLMDDLHRALVLKIYITVCEADREWSAAEREMAEVLFEHLWHQRLKGEKLVAAARKAAKESDKLQWYSIIRPFDRLVPLRDRIGALETVVMRLANLIGRADGALGEEEASVIRSIRNELQHHLRPVPIDEPTQHNESHIMSGQAIATMKEDAGEVRAATQLNSQPSTQRKAKSISGHIAAEMRPNLDDALKELNDLIGLASIKYEVRTLVNYLRLQQRRGEAGLSDTEVSLHMVFTGNPGTGKTSVSAYSGKDPRRDGHFAKGTIGRNRSLRLGRRIHGTNRAESKLQDR